MCVWERENTRALVYPPFLLRIQSLSDYCPVFMTSFNLNYITKGPKRATLKVRASVSEYSTVHFSPWQSLNRLSWRPFSTHICLSLRVDWPVASCLVCHGMDVYNLINRAVEYSHIFTVKNNVAVEFFTCDLFGKVPRNVIYQKAVCLLQHFCTQTMFSEFPSRLLKPYFKHFPGTVLKMCYYWVQWYTHLPNDFPL